MGGLVVATQPPGLSIRVDGAEVKQVTPIREPLALSAGEHTVTVELPDGRRYDFRVEIRAGETAELWKRLR